MNNCKWLYADLCYKPSRCREIQEKCIDYHDGKCPDHSVGKDINKAYNDFLEAYKRIRKRIRSL